MQKSAKLKRSLGLWPIVMLGVGYMTPMVVFDTFGIASNEANGHVPLAYIVALAAMLFTAFSYGKMVRAFPSAGSAYTYTQKTISPHLGFLVGWSALTDYLLLPMVNALLAQIYMSALFPDVPAWVWVAGFVAMITVVNALGANSTANFNTLLVIYQIVCVVVFVILAIRELQGGMGYGEVFPLEPFYTPDMQMSAIIVGATVLCFSFLGFDAVTTYAEETPNPVKTIPRAIFLTAFIGGVIFTVGSYFTQAVFPDISHFKQPDATSPEIALYVGGKIFQWFFLAAALAGTIASGLASHASVSRLLYVMGRDNIIPKKLFGYVHPRTHTPLFNVIFTGLISMTAVFFTLEIASSFISFGALIAFTFVNLSVIAHYALKNKEYKSPISFLTNVIIPVIGAAFVAVLWYNLESSSFTMGMIWLGLGVIYLLYVTKMFKVQPMDIHFEEAGESTYIEENETPAVTREA
ncbi:Putrescine importer PuuP [Aneurinibacillus migulanus]|uniref:APC family permease n=1 Tax=Aneurinibacillus migulanus TaxID=47500 RepID=UPI0005BB41F6|nr:APC family permease [Aneurinibacillus migulanus]KPD09820.1 Putrescine importer PuuP [Aneurinibacillus migulanus]CEH27908.1 Amino acid permease [Aneurinibacillus migulanus]